MKGASCSVNHGAREATPGWIRAIGLWQATPLNVTFIVGAGVFATIPAMVGLPPGPYALVAWAGAGLLIVMDGLVWSELGAALPRSGGSYHFLLECYGRDRWGLAAMGADRNDLPLSGVLSESPRKAMSHGRRTQTE
jgi:hypothetical protein